jgi:hypothetical protein
MFFVRSKRDHSFYFVNKLSAQGAVVGGHDSVGGSGATIQLGGDGEEVAAGVKSLILHPLGRSGGANTTRSYTFAHTHLSRHHLIRSSAEGGGGDLTGFIEAIVRPVRAGTISSIQHLLSLGGW